VKKESIPSRELSANKRKNVREASRVAEVYKKGSFPEFRTSDTKPARARATDLLLGPVAAAACETRRTSSSDLLLPLVRLQEKKLPMMSADDCFDDMVAAYDDAMWDMIADFTDGRSDQDLDALFHPDVFDHSDLW
jgi:hypothetical protein